MNCVDEEYYIRDSVLGSSDHDGEVAKRNDGDDVDSVEVLFDYFQWLCSHVNLPIYVNKNNSKTYFALAWLLFRTPFIIIVPHDKNRASDGMYLRTVWSTIITRYSDYSSIDRPSCSVLEMMVGMARRIDREVLRGPGDSEKQDKWFWLMLENAGFTEFSDQNLYVESGVTIAELESKLDEIMQKTKKSSGNWGFWRDCEDEMDLRDDDNPHKLSDLWSNFHRFLLNYPEKFEN